MEFIPQPRLPAPPVPVGEIGLEAPPDLPKAVPANPLTRLLPVAMMVAAVGMMALYFTSGAGAMRNPMFMFFPAMMLVSVVGTLAYGSRGTNRTAEINENRREYLRYIDTLDVAVTGSAEEQHRSLHWSHPAPESLWTLVGGSRMWERGPEDPDFCHVRVGIGEQPLCTRLVAPELGPDDESDPVTSAAVCGLIRHRSMVNDLPIAVAIRGPSAITVDGDTVAARALLRAMVCQLAVLHSPEDVQIAAVLEPAAEADWEWLKWLPHHQHPRAVDAAGSARMMYRSLSEAVADCTPDSDGSPHLAVIVDGDVATGTEAGSVGRVTLLQVGAALGEMAADHLRLHIKADSLTVQSAGDDTIARPDRLTPTQASACARRLAPYRPAAASAESTRRSSTTVRWAELMGLDDPARIDPAVQWTNTHGAASLRVPIGVSEHGEPVELDIKEAARNGMGPHGLCVGATGSGKSEFLRTLTLGMIATHSPDVLNLVLVDFKGGATFLGLERARHVSAIITNLSDEAYLVNRMRDALAGEMNRRQELLRAAGNFANTNEYELVRSQGAELPTLPALFIVVDEFSELLSQHPDFAELFVAIGRLGRSLGMHLLLASQRLDEGRLRGLETHLSYRICLKTFSASESRAVLGVPDAYHLPSAPGAAYLKTASGELVRFQTAFVSAPYRERRGDATAPSTRPEKPMVFTAAPVGQLTQHNCRAAETSTSTRTLFDSIVDRVADNGTPAHRVWLPPLMGSPTLDMLIPRDDRNPSLTVPIGLVDSPYEQRRDLLFAELGAAAGNVAVVGAPRSGKSTALRTLMMALATTHSPADVQFYCLDFGGGSLSSLRPLPHVGSVAGRHDVDLCRRTVAVMESMVRLREAQFRRLGIESVADYRRRRAADDPEVADDPFGDVFLVVDGWATLRQEFDTLEAPITALAAQGLSFGVHVVVVASRWAELRPAVKDQIGTRIELRLGDPADSEMDRKRARQLSGSRPGHGITRDGREMVIALPRFDGRPAVEDLAEAVAASAQRLSHRWDGPPAPPIELLPARVHHHAVVTKVISQRSATEMVVGLGERELEPVTVNFADQPHLLVLGEAECGKTSTLRLLCREIMRTNDVDSAQLEIVDFRRTLLGVVESAHLAGYTMSAAALTSRLPTLLERLRARMPGEQVTQQQLRTRSWWSGPDIYLVIDDYDLVGGAGGNPLAPLAEFLPHAEDLGLHVVVARRSGGAARAMFDPFLAGLRDVGCMGLMMSASPDEGVLLGSVRPSPLPAGRGTLITRGGPDQLIQVSWSDPP
jgi:S-DNA-T family DNA segregation ATPase FtsK/SpoIIIE